MILEILMSKKACGASIGEIGHSENNNRNWNVNGVVDFILWLSQTYMLLDFS